MSSFLRAMLTITDLGMLITDLEHRSLACNSKFGELFLVDSETVPSMEVEELREYVYPRLADREAWVSHLDRTYSEPHRRLEDQLILERPFLALKRTTGPVANERGEIIGRIWTFEDITSQVARQRRRDVIVETSTFHDPDPAKVCRYIVERVGEVFDATAILSIWEGDWMRFREVARPPEGMEGVSGNAVKDAYCRVALRDVRPVVVQDASTVEEFRDIMPAQLGFRRCVSVPICSMTGAPIGTLCFLDGRTDEPISGDDVEFMSVLANRLSTELERERLYEERSAQQRATLEQQSRDLRVTEQVLDAINEAFNYLGSDLSEEGLWAKQVEILDGVLGYSSAALVCVREDHALAFDAQGSQIQLALDTPIVTTADRPEGELVVWNLSESGLKPVMGANHAVLTRLSVPGRPAILALGSDEPNQLTQEHHKLHLTAIVEQVSLLLSAQRLQSDLLTTSEELRGTQNRLVQAEKLSVAGTLAASVAHDIRNIMASLSLICAQGNLSDAEKLAQVQTQIDRFTLLSHRLLSYVRPKSLSREMIYLGPLIDQAVALLGPQARISGVDVQVIGRTSRPVLGDSYRIEHLLVNLMMNALQAMRSTGGKLTIETIETDHSIVVTVADNGRGIPAHLIDRIFEPFVSSRPDGFGLGLYSCRQIALEHGWQLNVYSNQDAGTIFKIEIPEGETSK